MLVGHHNIACAPVVNVNSLVCEMKCIFYAVTQKCSLSSFQLKQRSKCIEKIYGNFENKSNLNFEKFENKTQSK